MTFARLENLPLLLRVVVHLFPQLPPRAPSRDEPGDDGDPSNAQPLWIHFIENPRPASHPQIPGTHHQ